jgi:plasmid maintenance system killer protein
VFDHVQFGVTDYAASKAFFLKALEPLGVTDAKEWPPNGVELGAHGGSASLCLYQTEEKPAHLHLAFAAKNRQQVAAFYRAALEAGAKDNGAPAAGSLDDLRVPPANRLEKLSGDRRGQHSIRINDQWRVCFRWRDGHAHDVEIVDYH